MARRRTSTESEASGGGKVGYGAELWQMGIAATYHAWRGEKEAGAYANIPGFCKSAVFEEVRTHGHVLTPGRFVGAEAPEEDAEPFQEKMRRLAATLREQQAEAAKLDAAIAANLAELGFGG